MVQFSPLTLGMSHVGSLGNLTPLSVQRRVLAYALDHGVASFDTADVYGQGDSERELGRLLYNQRERAFIVTKIGKRFSAKMRMLRWAKPLARPLLNRSTMSQSMAKTQRRSGLGTDLRPQYLTAAAEASLRRLRTDRVDVLLLHSPLVGDLTRSEAWDAMLRLKGDGKATRIGISCDTADAVVFASGLKHLDVVQTSLAAYRKLSDNEIHQIRVNGIALMLREVIRGCNDMTPADAVARAATLPDVATVVVGTSSPAHLSELIQRSAGLARR